MDMKLPFKQWSGLNSHFKFGMLTSQKLQDFSESNYFYRQPTTNNGANLFSTLGDVINIQSRVGLWDGDTTGTRYYDMGYVIERNAPGVPAYNAEQTFFSYYAMVDMPLFESLRFIGGVRSETVNMNVNVFDPLDPEKDLTDKNSQFQENDILPAAVFIYQLAEKMNFRVSYGKTLALPSFRELVPAETYEFIGGIFKIGNPDLKRSLIHSYDVRWEWYPNPGEIFGVSAFYKDFIDPIETKYRAKEKQMTWENVPEAITYGLEFEVRKNLRMISVRCSKSSIFISGLLRISARLTVWRSGAEDFL
jgi:outer membrane receptor protein involved in Fe transport